MSSLSFTVPARTPSILGSKKEVALPSITLAQNAALASAHVFPGQLDLKRFGEAVSEITRLFPTVCGRLGRREARRSTTDSAQFDNFISLTNSALTIQVLPAADPTLPHPFPTPRVVQPHLDPYVNLFDPHALLNNPLAPLLTLRITRFETYDVLGICWAHTMGDGAALNRFTEVLSRVYRGERIEEVEWPVFEGHVELDPSPGEEACERWDRVGFWPVLSAEENARRGKVYAELEVVELSLTKEEVCLIQSLARGEREKGWVSEQDGLSSYYLNLLRLAGEEVSTASNAINYRSFGKGGSPSYPPTLPRLVANVNQLYLTPLPPATSAPSLRPLALTLRHSLASLRSDPTQSLEWLSVRARRNQQTTDLGLGQAWAPSEGEALVNSNWRYDWNFDFGFRKDECAYHCKGNVQRYLRVFSSNDGKHAELSWKMGKKGAELVRAQVERDRVEGWKRWM